MGERLTVRKGAGILFGLFGLFFAMDAHFGGGLGYLQLALSSGMSWAEGEQGVDLALIVRGVVRCARAA